MERKSEDYGAATSCSDFNDPYKLIIIMADDKKIRESYYKRDKDFNEKIKEEMQE